MAELRSLNHFSSALHKTWYFTRILGKLEILLGKSKNILLAQWASGNFWDMSGPGYPLSAQRRLIRLGRCPGWSESSLGAHSICWFVMSWLISDNKKQNIKHQGSQVIDRNTPFVYRTNCFLMVTSTVSNDCNFSDEIYKVQKLAKPAIQEDLSIYTWAVWEVRGILS